MENKDTLGFKFEDEQHFSLFGVIKQLLREGKVVELDELFSSTDYHYDIEHIFFNDVSLAIASFEYMWAQSSYIAIEEGVDATEAGHLYEIHRRKLLNAQTILETLQENRAFHHALAVLVSAQKDDVSYSEIVRRCRNYVREHILEPPTVQSIADELGVSRGHLSALFKKETGQTLQEFIRALRLDVIIEYLENPQVSSTEIWQLTGFCSQSHYIQFFKQMTGKTPKEFHIDNTDDRQAADAGRPMLHDLLKSDNTDNILKQLDDYAEKGGFQQQLYQLYCVRKGRVKELQEELTDPQFQKTMKDIFEDNRTMALEALLYLLPQISSAAIDGGVSMKSASRVYIDIIHKTPAADCDQLLQLLSQAYLDYAMLVAKTQKGQ